MTPALATLLFNPLNSYLVQSISKIIPRCGRMEGQTRLDKLAIWWIFFFSPIQRGEERKRKKAKDF